MRYVAAVALVPIVLLSCAKDMLPSDDDIAADESTDGWTDTTGTSDCAMETESSSESDETTETDTTESTDTETGMVDESWYVMSGVGTVVGRLASPGPENFAFPGNMFEDAIPRFAYVLTEGNFAFSVNQHLRIFNHFHTDDLYFTGLNCDGTGLDHFARRMADDFPLTGMLVCNPDDLDGAVEGWNFPYGFREERQAWLDLNWPGAEGFIYDRLSPSIDKQWYEMPIEQQWPSWQVANSVLHIFTNTCEPLDSPMSMCAVEFYVSDYVPSIQDGPFHLEQNP
jgi:hypothetical protein